jgi:hypothetical protein
MNYGKCWNTEFPQHTEIALIIHLAVMSSYAPAVIGIYKACCILCYEFYHTLESVQ